MSARHVFAVMIGLGLGFGLFLVATIVLMAFGGSEALSTAVLLALAAGCLLVVARPAWKVSGRVLSDRE